MARRKIDVAAGAAAVRQWLESADAKAHAEGAAGSSRGGQALAEVPAGTASGATGGTAVGATAAGVADGARVEDPAERAARRRAVATAVRFTLEELAACAPGRSVEVRVPPFGATQAVAGTVHRRGTPPSVVETDADTWLALATGRSTWHAALASGALRASGERCDLSDYLPLISPN